jgi:hypothetical protein
VIDWMSALTGGDLNVTQGIDFVVASGFFGWLRQIAGQVLTVIKVIGIVSAIGFVVYTAVVSKMQIGKVLMSLLVAAIFIWGLLNVDVITKKLDTDATNPAGGETITPGQYGG